MFVVDMSVNCLFGIRDVIDIHKMSQISEL